MASENPLSASDERDSATFPEPFFDRDAWLALRRQIEEDNVEPDRFLRKDPEMPVWGINLAFGWPFPESIKSSYEKLARALSKLGEDVYVYPYEQTHVTVMTLVSFKKHQCPTAAEATALRERVPSIVSRLEPLFSSHLLAPFTIAFGPPILSRQAAFLPILNVTKEVSHVREEASSALKELLGSQIEVPNITHSTVLRFLRHPPDLCRLLADFDAAARHSLGSARISEFLLTSENQPYMRAGEVLHRFALRGI